MSKWGLPLKNGGHMDKADGIYLQNMTWKQIEERLKKNDIIIIPVGATEAHGPHACIGEDTFLVTRMAELVAQKTGCTVSQPLWWGSHPYHHVGMPGTVVVPEEIFIGMLKSIMAGYWNMGFRKMILLNGHGQEYVIPTAIHQFAKTYQLPMIVVNVNWYHAIQDQFKLKSEGGPYETNFIHADEVETSWSLALFPEMIRMEDAVDTQVKGYMPEGHVDKAGNLLHRPIAWYGHVGLGPIEVSAYPEGVVGKATLADAQKAIPGIEAFLDYMVKLHDDILKRFPPGVLPPIEEFTQRPREEVEAYLKGPLNGGRSIYELRYPPA
ncbi:creatininase family protein [Desulfofundulus sp. TPOSR]|uniref:Creatininase n=2 Tax=Desulfofundulus TaxID=2282741 RepID=A0AAU8PB54_DESK7|nr:MULTISPECIES: 3-dehydro-scyllo-inosose hydrolase [Desulfofundulus]AEG15211.1 Creatininase [Desulfofundulus kuznetsovii DSM 6115]MDQ0285977.1 creatinine amidohydrolase [Desulfofundulus luciae]NHM28344.1 creatininase family protein [Desulfofundulus sp. TPOSR]